MIAVRPDDDQHMLPGRRLRVQQDEPDGLVCIVAEVTLPERVHRIDAHRATIEEEILLTVREATWLHAVLGELLRAPEDLDLAEAPPQRLIEMHRDLTALLKQEDTPDGNPVVHAALVTRRAAVVRALAISNARSAARGQP